MRGPGQDKDQRSGDLEIQRNQETQRPEDPEIRETRSLRDRLLIKKVRVLRVLKYKVPVLT
jgi:hypothetical protein